MTERPAPLWRRFAHFRRFGTAKVVQGATNTRDLNFPLARKKSGRRPYLCFVLHRMGFLMRPRLHEGPVGSYPAFSTLPRTIFERRRVLDFAVSSRPKMCTERYIFCDTFRYLELSTQIPSLFARHAALWCSDFPLVQQRLRQRPPVTPSPIPRIS